MKTVRDYFDPIMDQDWSNEDRRYVIVNAEALRQEHAMELLRQNPQDNDLETVIVFCAMYRLEAWQMLLQRTPKVRMLASLIRSILKSSHECEVVELKLATHQELWSLIEQELKKL